MNVELMATEFVSHVHFSCGTRIFYSYNLRDRLCGLVATDP
jgi:hypothetical protein